MLALGQMPAICPDRRSVGKCETSALFATHIADRHRRAGRVLGFQRTRLIAGHHRVLGTLFRRHTFLRYHRRK